MPDMSSWMVGRSNVMQALRELVDKVAPTDATVLISGESGSGKELVAQSRRDGRARLGRHAVPG
jgi:DNA-binding NtrC family response regulator